MPNGRCRMHGGKNPGRPAQHGFYTQNAIADRRQLSQLIQEVNQLVSGINEGPSCL
jgi:hypothetical protein